MKKNNLVTDKTPLLISILKLLYVWYYYFKSHFPIIELLLLHQVEQSEFPPEPV